MDRSLVPGLKSEKITYETYLAYSPEKIELIEGNLCNDEAALKQLLVLLMYNIGLEETVRLAPRELWEQALRNV